MSLQVILPSSGQYINGGTGPLGSSFVAVTDGFGDLPPSVVLVNPHVPYNVTVLLDNFYGLQFNSMNDLKIHPLSGAIFFSDVSLPNEINIRPTPLMPNQVYRLDPLTRAVRVVATDFDLCNGIAFSADGKSVFVTDSGAATSISDVDQTRPATMYGSPLRYLIQHRGNVYAGCGDGVHVWSPEGTLLGKFFTGDSVANMQFAGDGRLVLLGGTKIYMARIAARGAKVSFPRF
uniref:SMP-30/Gluconolactonase/LRE-like region domain-containing protein n=1 Tax=Psilocybe cubensis TaxID=181762 RepID=A0A8H7XM27_PSICU